MPPTAAPTKLSESFEIWTDDILLEMTKKISEALSKNPESKIKQKFN